MTLKVSVSVEDVAAHHADIVHEYRAEHGGRFVWHVRCSCGFTGEDRMRPRLAECDLESHIRADTRPKTMTAGG